VLPASRCVPTCSRRHPRQCWSDRVHAADPDVWLEHRRPHLFSVHRRSDLRQCSAPRQGDGSHPAASNTGRASAAARRHLSQGQQRLVLSALARQ